jgi:MFS family permease
MHVATSARTGKRASVLEELLVGVRYVSGFVPVRSALILLALTSLLGMPYTVLMPAIATNVLHGGAHTLGFLMTASGAGALGGAFYLATRRSVLGLGRVMFVSTSTFGAGLVAFSFSHSFILSMVALPFVGAGMMITMASTNTIIQTIVTEELRGRVMAFYAMAFLGTAPIGSLLAGVAADRIGPARTILAGGVLCLATALWFGFRLRTLRAMIRPIYVERGILGAAELESGAKSL